MRSLLQHLALVGAIVLLVGYCFVAPELAARYGWAELVPDGLRRGLAQADPGVWIPRALLGAALVFVGSAVLLPTRWRVTPVVAVLLIVPLAALVGLALFAGMHTGWRLGLSEETRGPIVGAGIAAIVLLLGAARRGGHLPPPGLQVDRIQSFPAQVAETDGQDV